MKKPIVLYNEKTVFVVYNSLKVSIEKKTPKDAQAFAITLVDKFESTTEDQIHLILLESITPEIPGDVSKTIEAYKAWQILDKNDLSDLFIHRGPILYLSMNKEEYPLPESIITYILALEVDDIKKGVLALKRFILLLFANPTERVRQHLLEFMINHHFELEEHGLIVAYRNVVAKENTPSVPNPIVPWLNDQYPVIKKAKKALKNYNVYVEGTVYSKALITKSNAGVLVGNFHDLYEDLIVNASDGNTETFTDQHSGTTVIEFGKEVVLPIEQCDTDESQECSRGLHFGNVSFLSKNYFGNQGIMILVNPAKVVAVPYVGRDKARSSSYIPVCKVEYGKDNKVIPMDTRIFSYEYLTHQYKEQLLAIQKNMNNNLEKVYNSRVISENMSSFVLNMLTESIDSIPLPNPLKVYEE